VTFEHYQALFTRPNLGRYLFNSGLISLVVTVISGAVNSMAGYAFAKLRFRGRDSLFRVLVRWTLLVFLFLQRYYIQGVMAGSVKR